ncbi:MAG: pyrroloquinoline quinone biosynthesis protein PqqB [Candidatus Eremiobacteraeota bacterium]|nr:pyrroloquinoline quinone biosynthesis protein PqqB [Candidatus Eremiobacteraeota bacterium]
MIVRVLGSAAGGGVPQWNCACANCQAARTGRAPRRTQSSLAVSVDGIRWLLLNCSPDIAAQIEAFTPLHPPAPRGTPIAGMLFTDANVDHIGGLAVLRQRGGDRGFLIRSSAVIREIAAAQPSCAPFAAPPHRWLDTPLGELIPSAGGDDLAGGALIIRTIAVPGTTPGYDGRRRATGAVVAYEVAGRNTRKSLLFAPVFSAIDDALRTAIERASVAFLDGSFYGDDEMIAAHLLDKPARGLGHQPVGGSDGTMAQLRHVRTRLVFTHLNNSNPMLDSNSEAYAAVREFGAELAFDGMELTL